MECPKRCPNKTKCNKKTNRCESVTKVKPLDFEIEEDNFKEVYYRDVAECNRKFIKYDTLCRRISSSGKCFAVRDLCIGEHPRFQE